MKYSLTIFDSIFDTKTKKRLTFNSLDSFENLFYSLSKRPGYKPKKNEFRQGSSLITPASYDQGSTRANKNVLSWNGWAALDVDEYEGSLEDNLSKFSEYYYICYSSASSTKAHPKCRLIIPLEFDVKSDKIRHFWYALNHELGSIGDAQTKDLSRMYYVPAQYPNAFNFIFTNKGRFVNPEELMNKHSFDNEFKNSFSSKLPEEIQKRLNDHRKNSLNNTSITWSNYHDCPFISKNQLMQYKAVTGSGWYSKIYQIMVSIAAKATRAGYPIQPSEIAELCRQIDNDNGGWYKNRPLTLEAARAIDFSLTNM